MLESPNSYNSPWSVLRIWNHGRNFPTMDNLPGYRIARLQRLKPMRLWFLWERVLQLNFQGPLGVCCHCWTLRPSLYMNNNEHGGQDWSYATTKKSPHIGWALLILASTSASWSWKITSLRDYHIGQHNCAVKARDSIDCLGLFSSEIRLLNHAIAEVVCWIWLLSLIALLFQTLIAHLLSTNSIFVINFQSKDDVGLIEFTGAHFILKEIARGCIHVRLQFPKTFDRRGLGSHRGQETLEDQVGKLPCHFPHSQPAYVTDHLQKEKYPIERRELITSEIYTWSSLESERK